MKVKLTLTLITDLDPAHYDGVEDILEHEREEGIGADIGQALEFMEFHWEDVLIGLEKVEELETEEEE